MLRKYIPVKDIPEMRDIVKRAQEFAKTQASSPTSDNKSALPGCGINQAVDKAKQYSVAQKEEYIEAMKVQMASKDFQQRIEALEKIVEDCKEKPYLVMACKFPVFDAIVARLQESNRKINQHTLEALQAVIPLLKDSLAQVVNILVPAIVDNHLSPNSKISGIHNAADDNALLLEVLCTKAHLLNGKAKGHLIVFTHLKQLELQHINNPRKALAQGLELFTLEDWEKTITGLNIINSIVQSHPDILVPRLHDICLALILEVTNLRSCVSRVAVSTLGMMYTQLQKKMDPEVELTAVALLQKVGIANEFIRQDIDAALDSMVRNCTATYVIKGLLAGGMRHLNSMVRKCASQRLLNLAERTDAARLLSDTRGITEYILPTAARLAQDPSQEVR
ncbi:hypothetical protein SKAU_G00385360 [Synaphobranchus kaupii]|nr:hypothetical protein SKAU_G00385340 [Synaphobranchus kaupii]KAJ8337315.1 hypothetical protein SKAU_G00385350 [Synaphobranchus kaupii]KAJ8337316.1 hypothetical protein SKAU_G00385360 [Synaphobranchus kaupii]